MLVKKSSLQFFLGGGRFLRSSGEGVYLSVHPSSHPNKYTLTILKQRMMFILASRHLVQKTGKFSFFIAIRSYTLALLF